MRRTRRSTDEMSCAPPVSNNTTKPSSQRRFIKGREVFCNNGSPPVSSTNGNPKQTTCGGSKTCPLEEVSRVISDTTFFSRNGSASRDTSAQTSSIDFFLPSVNAYAVSQYEHRRSQAVRRTKMQGKPVNVLSPCTLR